MKSRIIKIGNSQGVRIPKVLLEEAGLSDDVELGVEGNSITIRPISRARNGWAAAFAEMAERRDDELIDASVPTFFDEDEWEWA
jgi:antitoxin MazE